MTNLDWSVVGLYVLISLAIGAYFSKRASQNTDDFFAAGRSLPWWIAGTSLVASTFSTDTPLLVAGLARNEGIQGNWFWWSAAIGATATIFFFAKLWRRTGVLTDVEFVTIRYDASPARSYLRIFKVLFDGVFTNCITMAIVTLAGAKIIEVILGFSPEPVFEMALWGTIDAPLLALSKTDLVVMLLGGCAVAYTVLSGLYGVVYTDLIQFVLAMFGSIWLAVVVYLDASKNGFLEQLRQSPHFHDNTLAFVPDLSGMDMVTFTFMTYVFVYWWGQAPGSGYTIQRLLATRSERDAVLAYVWYTFCHYVLRSWPWITVGLASMIYFPDLTGSDAEMAYPMMINRFLQPGIKGVMVAAMLAAYMSTLDTQLNWGASYLVNDLYQPFFKPGEGKRHYVLVSRVAMLALMILTLLISVALTGILDAYKYLAVIAGGIGTVAILRWYWWRVTAWSEIVAIISAFVIGNLCQVFLTDPINEVGEKTADWFAYRLLISTLGPTLIWVTFTYLTSSRPTPQAVSFYRMIRAPGPGWKRVAQDTGIESDAGMFRHSVVGWLAATAFVYSLLFTTGSILLAKWSVLGICVITAIISVMVLRKYVPLILRGS